MRRIIWTPKSWDDYLYWQKHDKRLMERVNFLIQDVLRDPRGIGLGKTEVLKGEHGLKSKHVDEKNRFVYWVKGEDLEIVSCRGHYDDD